MAFLIDTEGVPPGGRASHFLDAAMASPLPMIDASRSRFEADDFRARFRSRPLSDAHLVEALAAGLHLNRSRREIDRLPCGQLFMILLNGGACKVDSERRDRVLVQEPGDLCLLDLDAPQIVTIDVLTSATGAFIPRRHFPFLSNNSELSPLLIRPRDELHGLLKACLVASAEAQSLTTAAADGWRLSRWSRMASTLRRVRSYRGLSSTPAGFGRSSSLNSGASTPGSTLSAWPIIWGYR